MLALLWVGLGGFLGSIARYSLTSLVSSSSNSDFPLATFIINVLGSFVIGLVYGLSSRSIIGGDVRLFLATGICGGFTTFSAFSAETFVLIRDGHVLLALAYASLSVILGVGATVGGLWCVRAL